MYLADRDRPTIDWLIFADSWWAAKVHALVHLLQSNGCRKPVAVKGQGVFATRKPTLMSDQSGG
jgi:hypothetical protein